METTDFVPCLGKSTDTEEIRQLLKALGVKSGPKVKRGDVDACVTLSDRGIELGFGATDDVKSSLLVLNAVQFYGNTQGGHLTPYVGPMPLGLAFTDSRKATRGKLGKPGYSDDDLGIDIWYLEDFTLAIDYNAKATGIGMITFEAPHN